MDENDKNTTKIVKLQQNENIKIKLILNMNTNYNILMILQ